MSRERKKPDAMETVGVGAAAAAPFAVTQALRGYDLDDKLQQNTVRNWAAMRERLKPGDIFVSNFGKEGTYKHLINAVSGSTWYHPALYHGRGATMEALDPSYDRWPLSTMGGDMDTVVLRPKVSQQDKLAALAASRAMKGTPYSSPLENTKEGLAKLLGISARAPKCPPGSINCHASVSRWYPKLEPDRYVTPDRLLEDAAGAGERYELVGRVAKQRRMPWTQQIIPRVVHPALKWGLLAGVPAGLAYNYLASRSPEA